MSNYYNNYLVFCGRWQLYKEKNISFREPTNPRVCHSLKYKIEKIAFKIYVFRYIAGLTSHQILERRVR